MKILFATLTILFATAFTSAHATNEMGLSPMKATLFVSTIADSGDIVYYNCDYATQVTKRMLTKLGAQSIRVRCSGGLDTAGNRMPPMPVRLEAEFLALDTEGEGRFNTLTQNFRIKYSNDCHLPATVFKGLSHHFELSDVKHTTSCSVGRFARFTATGSAPVME